MLPLAWIPCIACLCLLGQTHEGHRHDHVPRAAGTDKWIHRLGVHMIFISDCQALGLHRSLSLAALEELQPAVAGLARARAAAC